MHAMAFPVCVILHPVSSRALLECLCPPAPHAFLDPSGLTAAACEPSVIVSQKVLYVGSRPYEAASRGAC